MQYQGGKARPAKQIAQVLSLALAAGNGRFIEPFVGGANVAAAVAPFAKTMILSDANEDMVLFWKALADGWVPPTEMSKEEYDALVTAKPSALRAFAGAGMSYAGKWFGGYAKPFNDDRRDKYTRAGMASRSALKCTAEMARCKSVKFAHRDYRDAPVKSGDVVYCDPPYAATTGYDAVNRFDSALFWSQCAKWEAAGAFVFVSEFTAPAGWVRVWSKGGCMSMRSNNAERAAVRAAQVDGLYCSPLTAALLGLIEA